MKLRQYWTNGRLSDIPLYRKRNLTNPFHHHLTILHNYIRVQPEKSYQVHSCPLRRYVVFWYIQFNTEFNFAPSYFYLQYYLLRKEEPTCWIRLLEWWWWWWYVCDLDYSANRVIAAKHRHERNTSPYFHRSIVLFLPLTKFR